MLRILVASLAAPASVLAAATLLGSVISGCSTVDMATSCEDTTALSFATPLSADGEYEIEVVVEDVRVTCVAPIVDGKLDDMNGCSAPDARPGLDGFDLMVGGTTRVETDTTVDQTGPRTVEGIQWRGSSSKGTVTVKKDGVAVPAQEVAFRSGTHPIEDCDASRMVGTVSP